MHRAISRTAALLLALAGCGGSTVASLLEDQAERRQLVRLHGQVRMTEPSGDPLIVAVLRVPTHPEGALQIVDYVLLARPGPFWFFVDPGRYRVIAFEDRDGDQEYDPDERLGAWNGFADLSAEPAAVLDVSLDITGGVPGPVPAVVMPTAESRSLLIGQVRSLDEARFGPEAGRRGMLEPLAFMREIGAGLFLLEDHVPGRTPVVLVHGMTGYPQEFRQLVGSLDRERLEPWLVQYPSGWELDAVADYLARGLVELASALAVERLCIVGHSMGGVVARRALGYLGARGHATLARGLVTLASPLGGIPGAAIGVHFAPVTIPAWSSLDPGGPFMVGAYGIPLPESTRYALLFAFDGESDGDGVVPMVSQLRREAQDEASFVRGFRTTHAGILTDLDALATVRAELERCRAAP